MVGIPRYSSYGKNEARNEQPYPDHMDGHARHACGLPQCQPANAIDRTTKVNEEWQVAKKGVGK